jgi:enoyl-CoA hydratase/carnithine racemase
MTDRVTVEFEDSVARVTLDNPDLRNALTTGVADGLVEAMETVADSDARCVVLASTGSVFCAGGDVNAMIEGASQRESGEWDREAARAAVERTASAVTAVGACDVPTVAALEGSAYGAGAALALACDVVVASEGAAINFGFRRLGLAVDSGTSYFLPRIVGESTAKELVFTGETVETERAHDLGLFNRVVPADEFDAELESLVETVATGPTAALSASKRLLEMSFGRSLTDAVAAETDAQVEILETDDHAEGVRAFTEGREPDFDGA